MSLDPELAELFKETVKIEKFKDHDGEGNRAFDEANPIFVKARIEQFARIAIDVDGRQVSSNTHVYLLPVTIYGAEYSITVNDRLTLPDGYYPQAPAIISVQREDDEDGLHHWVVNL
jgi:hypothetical protein